MTIHANGSDHPSSRPRIPLFLALSGAVLVGVLTAAQSRINSGLATESGDGYVAAVTSFGSGLLLLLIALAVWRPGRVGLVRVLGSVRAGQTPWWYLVGGAAGATFVLAQSLTAGVLGVALFTVATVCGQTISGLLVDRAGLGSMAPVPVTITRLTGSVLALVAVAWSVSSQLTADVPVWVLALPLIAGLGLGWQQAVNGQVRVAAGSALTATFGNFLAGTVVLLIACGIHLAVSGWTVRFPSDPLLYSGGVVGVAFIGLAVVVIGRSGALLLGLGAVAGQLVMSLALDLIVPVAERPVATTTVAGTALTLVAVLIAATPSRALRRR